MESTTTVLSGNYSLSDPYGHAPSSTLVDLDYPMYGHVKVKCNGRDYSLDEVKAALKLVDEARKVGR